MPQLQPQSDDSNIAFPKEGSEVTIKSTDKLINPFPGLRPFTMDECHLFFGREGQVDDILIKLSQHRTVTVMGYSGSGKSSLMFCGLLPVLYGGFMTDSGPFWQVLIARPGNSPITNLAESAVNTLINQGRVSLADKSIYLAIFKSILLSGSNGLVELSKFIRTKTGENIFYLIDQFEELFRLKELKGTSFTEEAFQYVNLILNAVNQREVSIYLSINMRSDFIGYCANFPGLTQMINKSNYLVPQMSREQKRIAIEGPVAVGGGKISRRLVKRLLADIGENQDQLPILQHALLRTWDYWKDNREPDEPMDIRHYNSIGKVSQALSIHANEIYEELTPRQREIAEILFKNVTEKSAENAGVRRPSKVGLLTELSGASENEVIFVIDQFRKPGRSFLMPGAHVKLNSDSIIELSHESLMRIWTRLSGWVDEEYESSRMYLRLSDAAAMYQIGKTGLWRPPDLQLALNWQKKQRPTRSWAQRYDVAFERAIVFLDTSRITYEAELKNQEMLQQRLLGRARITNIVLGVFLLLAIGLFFYGITQQLEANSKAEQASLSAKEARHSAIEAKKQQKEAELQKKKAEDLLGEIKEQNKKLDRAYLEAKLAKDKAEKAFIEAQKQERIAISSQTEEKKFRILAEKQTQKAKEAYELSNRLYILSIAQSLEAKSVGIEDNDLAGLAALQGYLFHTENGGNKYDPYVFKGLYSALTKLYGTNYNSLKANGSLTNRMYALSISRKGSKFFTTGSDGKIYVGSYADLSMSDGLIGSNAFPNKILALSNDEDYLAVGGDSTFIQVYNLNKLRERPIVVNAHNGQVYDIKFLPDNSGFISVSKDKSVRFTSSLTWESKKLLTLPVEIKSIDINYDGTKLIGASNSGSLVLVNLLENTYSIIRNEAPNRILSVAFHPKKNILAYGTELLNNKGLPRRGSVKIINLQSGTEATKELTGHNAGVSAIKFSPDGLLISSAGLDNKLQMLVLEKQDELPVIMDNNNGNIWDIAFSPSSEYLLASCNNGEIRVWPTNSKTLADQICPKLARNLTADEWQKYIGSDVSYQETCPNK
jgi:WD40 repeat protein/energy-coupling factor transporter ATP-binding protein EcfA2